MHVERTFSVPRPVETVFDYLSDFTTTNEWDPGTIETTRTSGDGGVGTTYANTSEFNGRRTELVYETRVHERPDRVHFQGKNKTVTTVDAMSFVPSADGAGTQITYRADFQFVFPLNLVAPLVLRGKLDKLADETVEQIEKSLLDRA
jgi:carbon monoxide dehydrogenase subunit G